MNDVEIKIISTIKIQTIIGGKKTTRRRFSDFGLILPQGLKAILLSYCKDVLAEAKAELRTPEDWVKHIKKHTRSKQLRGWAASIIWFKYGGNDDNVLYKLSKSYDHTDHSQKVSAVIALLERMVCPRFVSEDAATRERERSKVVKDYIKNNEPITLETPEGRIQ